MDLRSWRTNNILRSKWVFIFSSNNFQVKSEMINKLTQ